MLLTFSHPLPSSELLESRLWEEFSKSEKRYGDCGGSFFLQKIFIKSTKNAFSHSHTQSHQRSHPHLSLSNPSGLFVLFPFENLLSWESTVRIHQIWEEVKISRLWWFFHPWVFNLQPCFRCHIKGLWWSRGEVLNVGPLTDDGWRVSCLWAS